MNSMVALLPPNLLLNGAAQFNAQFNPVGTDGATPVRLDDD
jgi:hypothetical protein